MLILLFSFLSLVVCVVVLLFCGFVFILIVCFGVWFGCFGSLLVCCCVYYVFVWCVCVFLLVFACLF